jgi:hypothetical protein
VIRPLSVFKPWMGALILLLVALLACAGPAAASRTQETVFQDDPKIVFPDSSAALDRTMSTLASLGVDRIRVSVFWELFGPHAKSTEPPAFEADPGDPASYEDSAWGRYDGIVRVAATHGIGVLFDLTGPAPRWAAKRSPGGVIPRYVKNPDAGAFGDFVEAVGRRYDGTWPDPQGPTGMALPAVDHWSLWNEPNYPSWLWPQWSGRGRNRVPSSPRLYRRLADAAYSGLKRSGHEGDVILLGETSPGGARRKGVRPLPFIREVYCLTPGYKPYHGRAARARGCPTTAASRGAFASYHPVLFKAAGWAHHAYSLFYAPTYHNPDPQNVTIGDIPRLTKTLDRVLLRWGKTETTPDVWITEHGYQTKPPDPFAKVSPAKQARWITQADFLTYRNPRVASSAQFLLYDDRPRARFKNKPKERKTYWGTWQSGLFTANGRPKPALAAYRVPLWVTPERVKRGRAVRVWAQYRPGAPGADLSASVEFLARGSDTWRSIGQFPVSNEHGTLDTRVVVPGMGAVRVVWTDPAKDDPQPTRAAGVRVVR